MPSALAGLPLGLRLEGVPPDGQHLRESRCPRPRRVATARCPDSSRRRRSRRPATTSPSPSSSSRCSSARMRRTRCACAPGRLQLRPAGRARTRHHHRRTRSSNSDCGTDEVMLIDECLTPDSSRFWPVEGFAPGGTPAELRQAARAGLDGGPLARWRPPPSFRRTWSPPPPTAISPPIACLREGASSMTQPTTYLARVQGVPQADGERPGGQHDCGRR